MKSIKQISIRYKDGKVSRLPRSQADELVEEGKANFISKTLYKAGLHGVTVAKGQSDSDIMTEVKKVINKSAEVARKRKEAKAAAKEATKEKKGDSSTRDADRQNRRRRRDRS